MICYRCGRDSVTVKEGFDLDTYIAECSICGYRKEYKDDGSKIYPQRFLTLNKELKKLREKR